MEHPVGRILVMTALGLLVAVGVAYGFCTWLNEILRIPSCDWLSTQIEDLVRWAISLTNR
jgi:hypothetical protein